MLCPPAEPHPAHCSAYLPPRTAATHCRDIKHIAPVALVKSATWSFVRFVRFVRYIRGDPVTWNECDLECAEMWKLPGTRLTSTTPRTTQPSPSTEPTSDCSSATASASSMSCT